MELFLFLWSISTHLEGSSSLPKRRIKISLPQTLLSRKIEQCKEVFVQFFTWTFFPISNDMPYTVCLGIWNGYSNSIQIRAREIDWQGSYFK